MTLFEIVHILKQIALTQPNVRSTTDGSIYDALNATNSVKYDVVHFSQTKHIEDEETDTYGFNIFYVSRLEDSLEDNRLQIQSIGKEVLGNILRSFCENWGIDFPEIIYYPFTQKFADLCAGVYCRVEIEVPKELLCADDYIDEITPSKGIKLENIVVEVDENGTRIVTPSPGFDGIGKVTIVTDVPGGSCNLEYKEVEYTGNGEYTIVPSSGYDGLSEVAVSISVPQGQGYEEGYEDGEAAQKAKLTVTSFTENNTYTREDGWSAVTVNVDDRYDEGYADGFAAGASACSGYFITALTLNVDSAITNYGVATSTYSPATAITDVYYTSSDPTIATIDSGTGVITVLSSGTVTICAKDSITHLQDCKRVDVTKTVPPTPEPNDYLTFVILGNGNIVWGIRGNVSASAEAKTIQYQKNGGEWSSITATEQGATIPVQAGDVVKFKGNNSYYSFESGRWANSFSGSTALFNLTGNIMSLLYGDNYQSATTIEVEDALASLFLGCSGLISAENLVLPATVLTERCYGHMFRDCTSLTTPPALPATTLAMSCYHTMFNGCTSLTTAPVISATMLAQDCYIGMFKDCTSLTTAPSLPATTLAMQCYSQMFQNCTSLTTAPELPATTLAPYCYLNMFSGCTSLVSAPVLSTTTLADGCYENMFYGCTNLSYIKCLATDISAAECTDYWTYGVASTGTFVKDHNMSDWTTGVDGIPSGWTIIDNS